MKVVIVAKTRMGSGACIGGITFDGRSVRLIAADQERNERFNMEYEVGQVWDVETRPDPHILPPHTENVIVTAKRRLPPLADLPTFIEQHMPPREGGPEVLYDGRTEATPSGALFVCQRLGVPEYSTMFWRPDRPLLRDEEGKRIRYRYPTPEGGCTLTLTGFQEPLPELPAGTLLRVSLAHWWRPRERPEEELRCYVQLSGWFLPAEPLYDFPEPYWEMEPEPVEWQPALPVRPEIETMQPLAEATMRGARQALRQVFGFDSFRPLQAEIIENLLAGRDTLAVMPTGSGKSLCFQLPALLFPGLTVVVSPLISLMQDQVEQLQELGIPAVALNSSLTYGEYTWAVQQIRSGAVRLVYAAPETLLRPETLLLLDNSRVDCLTIDEAHCISEWGHDFRPEYRQLVDVRRRLPDAVCIAMTATATGRVRRDIKHSLGIRTADEFVASFDRENLFLAVEPKTDGAAQTAAFVQAHAEQSGIIYCATRARVEELAEYLRQQGFAALPYHAGLDDETRRRHQRRFSHDDVPIMVATIAFGMGINKSNVRFILHYDLPKNLESYYQQIGRAGRDGLRADCLLLFSHGDVQTIQYFIRQQDAGQRPGAIARLGALLAFAETNVCRRKPLLRYFGETYAQENCEMCDNCLVEEDDLVDLTIPAQKFLSCVRRTGEIFGAGHVIDVLRGSRSRPVLSRGHDRLSTYNIGREFSKSQWQHLARQFVQQGLLVQDMTHGSLKLTEQGYGVFKGEPVRGIWPGRERRIRHTTPAEPHDPALFALLRDRRKALADAAGVPPYVIFSDRSLVEMATYFPQSRQSFARIYGVGEAKLENYADEFLPLIGDYCGEKGLEERRKLSPAVRIARSSGGNRREEVMAAYNGGESIAEIAGRYGVKRRTVVQHLWKAAQEGVTLRPEGFLEASRLDEAERERAQAVFEELGTEFLRPVFDALDGRVGYDELDVLRLYLVAQSGPIPGSGAREGQEQEPLQLVVALGNSGNVSNVPELISFLEHPDGNVRRLAASALGKLGDRRAVQPLLELLQHEQKPQVRQYAVKALGKLGAPAAQDILRRMAADENEKEYTRKAAEKALKQCS